MPLIKRAIEPINLSRSHISSGVKNELECVTNNTLANVIRQLSSLSKHAEDMFGELYNETGSVLRRANQLQERVDKLKVKVTQLDSTVEEVSLQDINLRKPFKSSVIKDQQIVTLATRPLAITEAYKQCDSPPALDKLNAYREDGKDSMKFYTDPTYFFELWCLEMQKDTEMTKKELHRKRQKRGRPKSQRGQQHIREAKSRREELQKYKHGKEFAPQEQLRYQQQQQELLHHHHHHHHMHHHMHHPQGGLVSPPPYQATAPPGPHQHGMAQHRHSTNPPAYDNKSPSRPSSLELNQQQLQQIQNYGRGEQALQGYPNGPTQQPPSYAYTNGPMARQSSIEEASKRTSSPHYQPPPPYNHNHNVDYGQPPTTVYSGSQTPGSQHSVNSQLSRDGTPEISSPQHTPKRSGTPNSVTRVPSVVTSPRPAQPPPAPPPGMRSETSPMGSRSGSASRESLPPPPPPPPTQDQVGPVTNHVSRMTPPYVSPTHHAVMNTVREEGSPARHTPSPQLQTKSSTPDSMDFPPPPPPPLSGTPDTPGSLGSMPPPPATPPPPEPIDLPEPVAAPAPPPPPPPPPPMTDHKMNGGMSMMNGGLPPHPIMASGALGPQSLVAQMDSISLASNASSATVSSGSTMKSDEAAQQAAAASNNNVGGNDERSELLAAIREGIQLRKVEERRQKDEQKRHPVGRLDVQSIMEQAFEMRRKALEENCSDDEDEFGEEEWSDED